MSASQNISSVITNKTHQLTFGWTDYSLFGGLLGISLLIGLYFGLCSKQDSASEYLQGGKSMAYFPVAISILASLLSGITFLGIPTEIYFHGAQFSVSVIPAALSCILAAYIFLPIFYHLRLTSCYEYLELRFSRNIRMLASFMYIVSLLLYIPIVIYVPSLAFSQVTSYSIHTISPVFSLVCITYTTMGGVKAVVWTDTIQFIFTVGGVFTILIMGINAVGGLSEIWRIADEGDRLVIFDMDPSPFSRNAFWGMTIGQFFLYVSRFTIGQKFVQRFLAIEKESDIKKAIFVQGVGWLILMVCCIITGLTVYAKYHNCDPLTAKLIERNDQIVPYFVMDVAGHIHGLPGIFLAGLVSSALSTMSASLNTLSGIIYKDFIDKWIPDSPNKEAKSAKIMKLISFLAGLIVIALIFVIERLGTIFEMAHSLSSIVDGPLLGLFVLGMFFPCVSSKGAIAGTFSSIIFMSWLVAGIQWHTFKKNLPNPILPTSVEDCSSSLNETIQTTVPTSLSPDTEPMLLYKISFLYLGLIGTAITVLVALITSLIIGESDLTKIDPEHIAPILRRFLPKTETKEMPMKEINQNKITSKSL